MRRIFKLLDIIFILLGLPFLYVWVLSFIQHRSSTIQDALFILMYLLVAYSNYIDKWNKKEKKGFLTYPLLVTIVLYGYFQMKMALIGGFLTLFIMFFKRFSTILVSGGLLALWVTSYIGSGSIRSMWSINNFQDTLSGWKIIYPLLAGWLYFKLIGRFYPNFLKDVPKKSFKRFRFIKPKLPNLNLIRKKSRKKGISLFRRKVNTKPALVKAEPTTQRSYVEESVPINQIISLIQEMTKEKGFQLTPAAKEALSHELYPFIGKWKEDRLYLWAKSFVKALDKDSLLIDSHAVYRALEKLKKSS